MSVARYARPRPESGGALDWRKYPRVDESYLQDPDAKILYQDYPSDNLTVPGYAKTDPRRGFVS